MKLDRNSCWSAKIVMCEGSLALDIATMKGSSPYLVLVGEGVETTKKGTTARRSHTHTKAS